MIELAATDFLTTVNTHRAEIARLLGENNIEVCMAPDEHRSSYRYAKDLYQFERPVWTCDACAAIRQAELDKRSSVAK